MLESGADRMEREGQEGCAGSPVQREPGEEGAAIVKGRKGWLKSHVEVSNKGNWRAT